MLRWGEEVIVGKQMVEEWKAVNLNELAGKIKIPCKFIFAEKAGKYEIWKPFLNQIKVKNEVTIVKNATHCFVEEGTEQELFNETLKWVK